MEPKKILVAYFSRAGQNYVSGNIKSLPVGNTKAVAQTIARIAGADLFEIEPVKEYPADYTLATEVAQQELRAQARPALKAQFDRLADYDTIVVGYPSWWGTMPMPVFTFLESQNFARKTILPLCTHEGSGLGRSEADIRKACPRATVSAGLALKGSAIAVAEPALRTWLSNAGVMG
jgi:flavodoxin